MYETRTNGLIPRNDWKPLDMKAALWRTSLALDKDKISPEEYKNCKRPHWPPVERIVEWGNRDWNKALVQSNLERSPGSKHYPKDAMKGFHAASENTSGYLDAETFKHFVKGSKFPSHGICYCSLAGRFHRLRYFCGFASRGELLMDDHKVNKRKMEAKETLREALEGCKSKSQKTYRDRKDDGDISWFKIVDLFGGWKKALRSAGFDVDDGETYPEQALRAILEDLGVEYRQEEKLPEWGGAVDFYLPAYDCVAEADGDYWHGHPTTYPYNDIQKSGIKGDREKDEEHRKAGRKVVRVWEHSLENRPSEVKSRLEEILLGESEFPDGHLFGDEPKMQPQSSNGSVSST